MDIDETEDLGTIADQIERVDEILQLSATDYPTDSLQCMVKMSQDIYCCKLLEVEKPDIYAGKFQGLAKRYLTMCNVN